MKTLLATDGSDYATTAMVSASRLIVHPGDPFDMICVIPEFYPPARSPRVGAAVIERLRAAYEVQMRAQAGSVLETGRRILRKEGVRAEPVIATGSPADVLLERAENYDVIVAGVHRLTDRPGPGLGPVAGRVLERAPISVLIGRPLLNEKSFRILVAVDGSRASENAVETLASSFKIADAEITLMHVIEKPWLHLTLQQEWTSEVERSYGEAPEKVELEELFGRELRLEADDIIEAARALLPGDGAATESLVVEGNPGVEILRQAEAGEYDLAVIGATGASDLKHTMLGSVSFRLASHAPCSVAVIR